jgi:hypothetical protein
MAKKVFKAPPLAADAAVFKKIEAKKAALLAPTVDFTSGSEGADVFFSVSGIKSLSHNLLELSGASMDAAGYELATIAREIIEDAKENYCPYLFGHLKASGDSDEYQPNKGIQLTQIMMWFGGVVGPEAKEAGIVSANHYALEQHENMEFKHPIGGPKYLERPFDKVRPTILPRLAVAIGKALDMNPSFVSFGLGE